MTNLKKLKELMATAPAFPSELVQDEHDKGFYYCPLCEGEGTIGAEQVAHARSNAWAGGVQFYGVGHEHQHAEKFYLTMRNLLPAFIAVAEAADRFIGDHPPFESDLTKALAELKGVKLP